MIVAIVLLGGCGSTDSSTEEPIVGHWVTEATGVHAVFLADGTYGKGHSAELASPDDIAMAELEWGTWSTDGNALTLTPDEASPHCKGRIGTYEIDVLDGGNRLDVTVLDDECFPRHSDFGSGLIRHDGA